jgi:membrane peptidoglycan carboxypeptidase
MSKKNRKKSKKNKLENAPKNTEKKLSKAERRRLRKQQQGNKILQEVKKIESKEQKVEEKAVIVPEVKTEIKRKAPRKGVLLILFKILKWFMIILGVVVLLGGAAVAFVYYQWGRDLPDVRNLKEKNFAETSTIYDREGNVLYKIYGEENRQYVPLDQINKNVIDATIAIEDQNFYAHFGFDPVAIVRAQLNNLHEDNSTQGASTITQQLAKNLYLSPEQTWDRKIKELLLSVQIEWYYSKDEILEMYLNKIPYGSNAFGIEAASKTFFNKSSADLNTVEASILASLPKATTKFSPYGDNKKELMGYCEVEVCESRFDENYVWGRKDLVLDRMVKDGKINVEQFDEAWKDGLSVQFQELKHQINSPHFVFYVRDYLEKKYGREVVESGGLEIRTTLDPVLQKNAETILAERYETNVKNYGGNNAALVSLDPKTGGVLAMVGSVNYWDESIDGQVNVTTSLRQPGSTFKPLMYAAAIENAGIGSGTVLGDYKTKFGKDYVPNNSDNGFKGRMTIRQALAQSRNIPAIKAWYLAGEEASTLEFINKLGVTSLQEFKDKFNSNPARSWDFSYGPSMAIGSGEVRLLDLAGAYATFANNGKYNPVNPILEIRDRNGNVLEKYEDKGVQAMRPETAYIINSILSDIGARPAGSWRNILTIPGQNLSAKTGTSNKKLGNVNYPNNLLTLGYTPTILSATWVGNSDGKQLSLRAWGEFTAAPINKAFLELALKDKPLVEYSKPEGITQIGNEYYPPNWDKNKRYDAKFVPVARKDCTDQERAKDPVICKTKEQQEKDAAKKREDEAKKAAEQAAAQEPERPISAIQEEKPAVEQLPPEPVAPVIPAETVPETPTAVDNLPPASNNQPTI